MLIDHVPSSLIFARILVLFVIFFIVSLSQSCSSKYSSSFYAIYRIELNFHFFIKFVPDWISKQNFYIIFTCLQKTVQQENLLEIISKMATVTLNGEEILCTDILSAGYKLKLAMGNFENNGHFSKKVVKKVDIGSVSQPQEVETTNISIRYELGNITVRG